MTLWTGQTPGPALPRGYKKRPSRHHCSSITEESGRVSWCPHLWVAQGGLAHSGNYSLLHPETSKEQAANASGTRLVLPHPGSAPPPGPTRSPRHRLRPEAPSLSPAQSPAPLISSLSLSLRASGEPLSELSLPLPPAPAPPSSQNPCPPRPGPAFSPGPAPRFPPGTPASGPRYSAPQAPPPGPRKPLPAPGPAPRSFLGPPWLAGQKAESRRPARRGWRWRVSCGAGSERRSGGTSAGSPWRR